MKKILLLSLVLITHLSAEIYTTTHENDTISFDLPSPPEIKALEDKTLYKSYSDDGKRFLVLIGISKCACKGGNGLKICEASRFKKTIEKSEGSDLRSRIYTIDGNWFLNLALPDTNLQGAPQIYLQCTLIKAGKHTVALISESTETAPDADHAAFVASLSVESDDQGQLQETKSSNSWYDYLTSYRLK